MILYSYCMNFVDYNSWWALNFLYNIRTLTSLSICILYQRREMHGDEEFHETWCERSGNWLITPSSLSHANTFCFWFDLVLCKVDRMLLPWLLLFAFPFLNSLFADMWCLRFCVCMYVYCVGLMCMGCLPRPSRLHQRRDRLCRQSNRRLASSAQQIKKPTCLAFRSRTVPTHAKHINSLSPTLQTYFKSRSEGASTHTLTLTRTHIHAHHSRNTPVSATALYPLPMGKGAAKSFLGEDFSDSWIEAVALIHRGANVKHQAKFL